MQTPIILLFGQANTGKDTVASFIAKHSRAVAIAQADPMKRLAQILFDFTDEQLWGPSASRNAPDPRVTDNKFWFAVHCRKLSKLVHEWLVDLLKKDNVEAECEALSDWLDSVESAVYSGKSLTPRLVLQTLGTEWGRSLGRDIWSDYAIDVAYKLLSGGYDYKHDLGVFPKDNAPLVDLVVITDGRFRNEVLNVKKVGGSVIQITSKEASSAEAEAAGVKGHASEAEQKTIPPHFFSAVFVNDKGMGLEACEKTVARMMRDLLAAPQNYNPQHYFMQDFKL